MEQKLTFVIIYWIMSMLFAQSEENASDSFEDVNTEFLDEAQRQEWLQKIQAKFKITGKKRGPFGLLQDPAVKISAPRVIQNNANYFKEAVDIMVNKIIVVDPLRKAFVIGSKEFNQGRVLTLNNKGKKFKVLVKSVKSNEIVLKNTTTGEEITKNPNDKAGKGIGGFKPGKIPGVEPKGQDDDIILD